MAPKPALQTAESTSSTKLTTSGRKSSTAAEKSQAKMTKTSKSSKALGTGMQSPRSKKAALPPKFDIEKKVLANMQKTKKAEARKAERAEKEKAKAKKEMEAGVKKDSTETKRNPAEKRPPAAEKEKKEPKAAAKPTGVQKKTKSTGKQDNRPSAYQMLGIGSCAATATRFEDKNKKNGVLFRRTKRAAQEKKVLEKMQAAFKPPMGVESLFGSMAKAKAKEKENEKPFEIMKLPEEVRNRIWKLAVVHHPFCVWPNQGRGREQPDLAMSGRETRDEVLRVYYGANVFGVDITPAPEEGDDKVSKPDGGKKSFKKTAAPAKPDSIAEIKLWAEVLEKGGHLSQIRHWVFSFTPEIEVEGRIPEIDDSKSLIVYLNIWREDGRWRANVEVHREACCVLPGHEAYQKCVIQNSPAWLNGMVGVILDRAGRKGLTAEMLVGVATVLRKRAEELVDVRCRGAAERREESPGRG